MQTDYWFDDEPIEREPEFYWTVECSKCHCTTYYYGPLRRCTSFRGYSECRGEYIVLKKQTREESTAEFEAKMEEYERERERKAAQRIANFRFEEIGSVSPLHIKRCSWCKTTFVPCDSIESEEGYMDWPGGDRYGSPYGKLYSHERKYSTGEFCSGQCEIEDDMYEPPDLGPPACRKCGSPSDYCGCYG